MSLIRNVCTLTILLRAGAVCAVLLVVVKLYYNGLLGSFQKTLSVSNKLDIKEIGNFDINETCCWKQTNDENASQAVNLPPWLQAMSRSRTKHEFINVHKPWNMRLGNQLFNYASLFGVAWRNGRRPLWPDRETKVEKYFNIRIPIDKGNAILKSKSSKFRNVIENYSMTYETTMERLQTGVNVTLCCYLQSWKYFKDVEPALRQDLTFKKDILQTAKRYLNSVTPPEWRTKKWWRAGESRNKFVRVVIHIRRTDLVADGLQQEGWALPRPGYFVDAMNLFRNCCSKVLFIVMSDDLDYSKRTILGPNVRFVPQGNPAVVDMAIASLCDHAIITFGTFGFWAAWFANGITVTQQNFPTPNSNLTQRLCRPDFYKPKWIAV